jgi:hypothetical protein
VCCGYLNEAGVFVDAGELLVGAELVLLRAGVHEIHVDLGLHRWRRRNVGLLLAELDLSVAE